MTDQQVRRFAEARHRLAQARDAHARAITELTAATAELETAGAALAERVQLFDRVPSQRSLFPGRAD
jgi:hypothetical protein